MTSERIVRAIDPARLLDAFLDEFGDRLSDADFDAISGGGFRSESAAPLVPAAEVDPAVRPFEAYRILRNLASDAAAPEISEIMPAEMPLVLPLLPLYAAKGLALPPEIAVMSASWDFYLVRHVVHAIPREDGGFGELVIEIRYSGNGGTITLGMTPDTKIETRARVDANVKIGVTGDLAFDLPPLAGAGGPSTGVEASGGVTFLYSWSYTSLRATVTATGIQSSGARWHVKEPRSLVGDVIFATILRVPKGAREVQLAIAGDYTVEPRITFLGHLWARPLAFRFESAGPITVALGS